jgi:hypothetical protein
MKSAITRNSRNPVLRDGKTAGDINRRKHDRRPGAADQLPHHQLKRCNRSDQHLADTAHLLLDHAVQKLGGARHDGDVHQHQDRERHNEGARGADGLRFLDVPVARALEQAELFDRRLLHEPDDERTVDRCPAEALGEHNAVRRQLEPLRQRVIGRMIGVIADPGAGRGIHDVGWKLHKREQLLLAHALRELQTQFLRAPSPGFDLDRDEPRSFTDETCLGETRGRGVVHSGDG